STMIAGSCALRERAKRRAAPIRAATVRERSLPSRAHRLLTRAARIGAAASPASLGSRRILRLLVYLDGPNHGLDRLVVVEIYRDAELILARWNVFEREVLFEFRLR